MAQFMLVAFVIAITVCIVLNSKTKINIGLSASVFAYILGCWVLKMTPSELIKMMPSSIVFQLAVVAMFFSFPRQNGLMDVICGKILCRFKNASYLLPYAIWLCYFMICFLGSGGLAAILIFGVLSFRICDEAGLNPLIASVAGTATIPGSQMPWSNNGVITIGFMEPFFPERAGALDIQIALITLVFSLLFTTLICFVTGAFKKRDEIKMEKPQNFNATQRSNLVLIITVITLAMSPSLLKMLMPSNAFVKMLAGNLVIQMLALIGILISILFKFGNQKTAITRDIPWNTIILIVGMTLLMGVVKKAGTFDLISNHIATNAAAWAIAPLFALLAGILTLFADGLTVIQMLIGIAGPVVLALGINPLPVFSGIVITARFCASSPFSSAGGMLIGFVEESKKDRFFVDCLWVTFAALILGSLFIAVVQLIV